MAAFKPNPSAHLQADNGVLDDHALARLHAQALRGNYVDGRVGLFPLDVIAAQEYVQALAPTCPVRRGR